MRLALLNWVKASLGVAQVSRVTLGGTVAPGDTFRVTLNGTLYTVTAAAEDALVDVVDKLRAALAGSAVVDAYAAGTVLFLRAKTPGVAFTIAVAKTSEAGTIAVATPTPAVPFEVLFVAGEGPRPARPYATLDVLSEAPVGTPHTLVTDDDGEDGLCLHSLESHRRGTFTVSLYADNHRELATALELAVDDPALQEQLDDAGVVVVGSVGSVDYNRVNRATSFESFSVIDFAYGCRASRSGRIAVIETVEVTHNG